MKPRGSLTSLCSRVVVFSLLLAARPLQADNTSTPGEASDITTLTLEQLMNIKVEGAALHPQTLQEAPASVTVITAEDIRKYGYRTLGEALNSARGFYVSYNRSYQTVGVRGFNLPGDYASRILVLVNGHNMADNIFNFMLLFDDSFPIEMNLIQRIEIIRGPSSALYGTNGIFATINIITKTPKEAGPLNMMVDTGSFGEKKAQIAGTTSIGKNAAALVSGSVFNNSGESPLFYPQFNTPETNNGMAVRMDGEKGYHFFSNLTWRNWSITAVVSDRVKTQPISWGPTIFNDRGTHTEDGHNYVEAVYSRDVNGGNLKWRTYFDDYRSRDRFDYALDPTNPASAVEDNRQWFSGDWLGTQLTYRFDVPHFGTLTAGMEAKFDLQTRIRDFDVSPTPVTFQNIDPTDKSLAMFAQDERRISEHWKLNLGIRLDKSAYRHDFVTPRAALIYQPSSEWNYKFLYGLGFRNPSAFELYFDDGGRSALPNPASRPESADTLEGDVEHRIGKRLNLLGAAYTYRLHNLLEGVPTDGVLQYQNTGNIRASGLEIEINGRPTAWLDLSASYAFQKTDDIGGGTLENSPSRLAKLRLAAPIGRKLDLSSSLQYYSSRGTLAGATVAPVYLADFTLTTRRLFRNFEVHLGLRNAFNRKYYDPIALNPVVDAMQQPGRSFFLELIAHGAH